MNTDQDRATQEAEKRLKDEIDMHTELGEGDIPFTADVRLVLAALAECRAKNERLSRTNAEKWELIKVRVKERDAALAVVEAARLACEQNPNWGLHSDWRGWLVGRLHLYDAALNAAGRTPADTS